MPTYTIDASDAARHTDHDDVGLRDLAAAQTRSDCSSSTPAIPSLRRMTASGRIEPRAERRRRSVPGARLGHLRSHARTKASSLGPGPFLQLIAIRDVCCGPMFAPVALREDPAVLLAICPLFTPLLRSAY